MVVKKIQLHEIQGVTIKRPEMKFLVAGCGGDPTDLGEGSITCSGGSEGVCFESSYREPDGPRCYANGDPDSFCMYGK